MRASVVLIISGVVLVGSLSFAGTGMAQSAPFCADAQSVEWLDAFGPLSEQLEGSVVAMNVGVADRQIHP